jgi:hypothetical protein
MEVPFNAAALLCRRRRAALKAERLKRFRLSVVNQRPLWYKYAM